MKKFIVFFATLLLILTGCSSWYQRNESGSLMLITSRSMIKDLISSRYSGYTGPFAEASKDSLSGNTNYSQTNTQIQGIDEGDIVKTNGRFIIHVAGQVIRVIDVASSKAIGKIEYVYDEKATKFYYPSEVYLTNDKLIVMGSISSYNGGIYPMVKDTDTRMSMFWIGYQDTFVSVYDLTDPTKPVLDKNYELTGGFHSSRLTDNELLVIANQYNLIMYDDNGGEKVNDPAVTETTSGTTISSLDTKSAYVLPGKQGDSFVNILKLDLASSADPKITSFLGNIQTIYVDFDNLMLAQYRYEVTNQTTGEGKTLTDLLRFDLASLELKADASIEGYLLNQFSMDIFDGNIRVASTKWSNDGKVSNAIHVFNLALEPQSSIVNLAEGESIRAVRFMGEKGYLVTFENVDPLFVIDLSNPKSIKVTGELKVPGFSTYLHPVSDTVLFGIAEDLEVVPMTDQYGNKWNSVNRFGMKISLFDVSDPTKPTELESLRVVGQYGYTEASYNHRAVVYDTERDLLYLPYTDSDYTTQVCETYEGKEGEDKYTYCNFKVESGIKVVRITETGVELVKSIVIAANNDYTNLVSRVLYVGDKLYAITYSATYIYDRDSFELITTIKY